MKALTLVGVACSAFFVTGCLTGPDYEKPDTPVPDKWSEPLEGGATEQTPELAQWWTKFNDPTLDSLVLQAIESNYDLMIAGARIREARAAQRITATGLWPKVDASGSYSRMQTKGVDADGDPSGSLSFSEQGVTVTGSKGLYGPGTTINRTPTGRYNVTQSFGANRPTISGFGDPTDGLGLSSLSIPLTETDVTPDRNVDLYQAGFDASWELDVFGGVRRAVEASKADTEAIEESRRDLLVTLTSEVARNYFALRSAQSMLDIVKNNIRIQSETYDIAKARFDAGLTSEYDVKTAEAQLASTTAAQPLLEAQVRYAIHRLGVLLGRDPGALKTELMASATLPEAPPEVPVGLPSELLRRRPDIRQAERQLAAATARIGVATADLFPKFTLTGSFGGSGDALSALGHGANQAWSIGPGFRWPVFDAGRIRANIEVQNARQEQALLGYENSVLLSLEEVENALVAYAKEQEHFQSLTKALDAERKALDIAKDLYAQGLVDFLSVLVAERSLYLADEQHTRSKVAILTELVSLYKALGGGWEDEDLVAAALETSATTDTPATTGETQEIPTPEASK